MTTKPERRCDCCCCGILVPIYGHSVLERCLRVGHSSNLVGCSPLESKLRDMLSTEVCPRKVANPKIMAVRCRIVDIPYGVHHHSAFLLLRLDNCVNRRAV